MRFFGLLLAWGVIARTANGQAFPQPAAEAPAIWFLRLSVSADRAEWLGVEHVPGLLKDRGFRQGALEIEVLDAVGAIQWAGATEDPCEIHHEYEVSPGAGSLTRIRLQRDAAEVEVRVPDLSSAKRLAVHRRAMSIPGVGVPESQAERTLLGEFEWPAANRTGISPWAREVSQPPVAGRATIAPAASRVVLATNGPAAQRINVVFLAEGFRTNEYAAFTNQAQALLRQFTGNPPFNRYQRHLNAYAVFVASAESGADHPSRGILRDTYFHATYDTSGIAWLVTLSEVGLGRVRQILRAQAPDYDIVAMVVNDGEYGGSGGFPLVTSVNEDSARIALHELGHSFAGLGDEYESPYPGYPDTEEPNTTRETNRSRIKWGDWILASTPVPTPAIPEHSTEVGLFEGAHYHAADWYRPKFDCLMRSLGSAFCQVCREAMTLQIYRLVRPVDAWSPATNEVREIPDGAALEFSVSPLAPTAGGLDYQWRLNGESLAGADQPTLVLNASSLTAGTNTLEVAVSDSTPWVRSDPQGRLRQEIHWRVRRGPSAPRLQVTLSANGLRLAWPAEVVGFRLEATGDVTHGPWDEVPGSPVIDGDLQIVHREMGAALQFFRLRSVPWE